MNAAREAGKWNTSSVETFYRSPTRRQHVALVRAAVAAGAKGIPVVISTRVPTGRVLPVYGFKGGGKTLKDAGAIFADDLSPQKAPEIRKLFDR